MKRTTTKAALAEQAALYRCVWLVLLAAALYLGGESLAYASSPPPSVNNAGLCPAAHWITGNLGRGLATLGIIILGIGALLGKVTWNKAVLVAIGIAAMFGYATITTTIGGTAC